MKWDTEAVLEAAQKELDDSIEHERTHLSNIVSSLERLLVAEKQKARKKLRTEGKTLAKKAPKQKLPEQPESRE